MRGDMMHPMKRQLVEFIIDALPNLLRDAGGSLDKGVAHARIHEAFRAKRGWPPELNESEVNGRQRWTNAWGWAMRWLYEDGVTKRCTKSPQYELGQ